ncbi:MAG: GFA family protein [Nitratireductor sp.]
MTHKGSCLCGTVKYTVSGELRAVTYCHCSQCRKQTGLYYATTAAADSDLVIEGGENITWFAASQHARRGFCGTCGSALFWKQNGKRRDIPPSCREFTRREDQAQGEAPYILCQDMGDYYTLNDDLPKLDTY